MSQIRRIVRIPIVKDLWCFHFSSKVRRSRCPGVPRPGATTGWSSPRRLPRQPQGLQVLHWPAQFWPGEPELAEAEYCVTVAGANTSQSHMNYELKKYHIYIFIRILMKKLHSFIPHMLEYTVLICWRPSKCTILFLVLMDILVLPLVPTK